MSSENIRQNSLLQNSNSDFNFQIIVDVNVESDKEPKEAIWVSDLASISPGGDQVNLAVQDRASATADSDVAGLYVGHDSEWYLAVPYADVCQYVVNGGSVSLYFNFTGDQAIPNGSLVYKNGIKQTHPPSVIPTGSSDLWVVLVIGGIDLPIASPSTLGGVRIGDGIGVDRFGIASVIPATQTTLGGVTISANGGLAVNAGGALSVDASKLPTATSTSVGVVSVPTDSGLSVDGQGQLKASVLSVAGMTGDVNLTVNDILGAAPTVNPTFEGNVTVPRLLPTKIMPKDATDNQPMLTLARASWAQVASTDIGRVSEYLHVGGREYGYGTYRLIGFGYDTTKKDNAPVYIGSQETGSSNDASKADFVIATRNSDDPSAAYEVSLRVRADGQLIAKDGYAPTVASSLVTKDYIDQHLPVATTAAQGVIQLATQAEVTTGTDNTKAVTPALLKAAAPSLATQASPGVIQIATQAEATAGTNNSKAVTPALLKSAVSDQLPIATTTSLGGVIVQDGLTVDDKGHLKAAVLSVAGRTGKVVLKVDDVSGAAPINGPAFQGRVDAPDLLPTRVMSMQSTDNQPMMTLARSSSAVLAAAQIGRSAEYLHVGGREYGSGTYRLIGFGYDTQQHANAPVYIGSQEIGLYTDASKADFIVATRNSQDPNAVHEVSLRVRNDGQLMAKDGYAPSTDNSLVTKSYIDRRLSAASTSQQGIIQIATAAEVTAGTDNTKAITPALLKSVKPPLATHTSAGIVQLATDAQALAGQDDSTAVTPKGLREYVDTKLGGQNVATAMHCGLMTPVLYSLTVPFDCWVEVLGNAYADYPEFAGESTTYNFVLNGNYTGSTATLGKQDAVIITSFKQYRANKGSLVQLIFGDGNSFEKFWYRVSVTFVLHGL